ncbi:MAG: Benzoate transport, ATPase component [Chloroflexi bacterium AL-W]|nr:Benzoate transport, ATPase component [Chloroflexi bacterium AL-N1]NOK67865.1 Benzoate transport, ATPase component [Chloroflexi bacterium AL-N10]NOK75365.1 Benzoate transport, ATPase component [Chloroflexi bacterium AL-N5]NOK82153.1 Benzoate transport, ATPase component [Chloroflexi bacterium AL-W]NOK89998.1 Benzoate transport, ATPase component [Chloroflexi bacterium AL-N15]
MNNAIIETRKLSRDFGGLRAVDQVDLRVQDDTLHAIIGPNGAGKTTLFNLISGYIKATDGHVYLRGRDITRVPLHRMAHLGIGRSFQITNVFPNLSVLENVRLSAQALGHDNLKFWQTAKRFHHYEELAHKALQQVGLADRADTVAAVLPHGDKRKLELAILLAADPQVLLLDEPTAGMATEQVPVLLETLRAIRKDTGKTILLVEHNMSVVMNVSDRITVMHQGGVLAEGTPTEITANTAVQQAYLGESYHYDQPAHH